MDLKSGDGVFTGLVLSVANELEDISEAPKGVSLCVEKTQ
jgi:hypothetical protein